MALASSALIAVQSSAASSQTVVAPKEDAEVLRARLAPQMNPAGRPMPTDAGDLDTMLQKGELTSLTDRLRAARSARAINLDMNWEQVKLYNGAGFVIAYAYMYDLWRLGTALPATDGEGLKESAAMMLLYGVDLITDGPQCADVSAPGHRFDQLLLQNKPIVDYVRALPRPLRMQVGTISLGIEAATAPVRTNDAVLCSGGLAEIQAGLAAQGTAPLQPVPNAAGTIGKTYAVPPAPGYRPQFVDEGTWRPKQAAARQALPGVLTQLLTSPDNP